MTRRAGRHFLHLPGPTNVPERVLRVLARPTIDHRGPEFQALASDLLRDARWIFGTQHPVLVHPSSASGAWEAALANTLSPGDRVLGFDQGFFARRWAAVAERFGLDVRLEPWDARHAVDADALGRTLEGPGGAGVRAVLVIHNETSTGVTTDVAALAARLRAMGHPALLLVDAVSSLACMPFLHDEWGIDVTVSGSQKGLMLPPGLSFLALGPRALAARTSARLPRAYWDWDEQLEFNENGFFPYTPATNLLYGLREALAMLKEEGLEATFARHARLARATRAAVAAWGLEVFAADPAEASASVTAVAMPDGVDADGVRRTILDRFDLSLGGGLGPFQGKLLRIGHLGDVNELMLLGALAGVEMGLAVAGVPHRPGGVRAAMDALEGTGAGGQA